VAGSQDATCHALAHSAQADESYLHTGIPYLLEATAFDQDFGGYRVVAHQQFDSLVSVTVEYGFLQFLVFFEFVTVAIFDDLREVAIAK
jgi:hypothetical protein